MIINQQELRYGNIFEVEGMGNYPLLDFSVDFSGTLQQIRFLVGASFQRNQIPTTTVSCIHPELWQVKAIPLTPEILEKCGFEPMRSDDDDPDYAATGWRAYYNAPYNDSGKDHFCIWDNQPDGYLMDNYSSAPLKYLHQLQSLFFALTGQELNLQL